MILVDVPPAVNPNPQPVAHAARCHTHACWHAVSQRRHIAWRWHWFHKHPMPRCTWDGESAARGASVSEYAPRRYRAKNPSSTAGGKYQILDTTWLRNGGHMYYGDRHIAALAPPMEQEKVARVVLRRGGIGQWANC